MYLDLEQKLGEKQTYSLCLSFSWSCLSSSSWENSSSPSAVSESWSGCNFSQSEKSLRVSFGAEGEKKGSRVCEVNRSGYKMVRVELLFQCPFLGQFEACLYENGDFYSRKWFTNSRVFLNTIS